MERGRAARPTSTIYVGVSLMGRHEPVCVADAGATWHEVAGAPTQYRPTRAALSSDGSLYVTYGDAPGPSRDDRWRGVEAESADWRVERHHAG